MRIAFQQPRMRALLQRLLTSGLEAVDAAAAVRRHVKRIGHVLWVGGRRYDLRPVRRLVAVGAGKAAARMAAALEEILGAHLEGGLVIVKYDHGVPTKKIDIVEAGHPLPDAAGLRAGKRLLGMARGLTHEDLLVVLLSGGASSLLPVPAHGVTLLDKQRTTQLLLRCGATIQEINAVRKHLSSIKGGRLAAATPASIITLILSDVIGDDLSTIGSGPTTPDPTTYADACMILRRYRLGTRLPKRAQVHLMRGRSGLHQESPKPGAPLFRRVHHVVIGNNKAAVKAVAGEAKRLGLRSVILSTSMTGEAREAARLFGAMAREITATGHPVRRPACLIAGGELTVSVTGSGMGGRAQEFALAASLEIAGLKDVCILGFGTDGTDGPTKAAGAVADGRTLRRAALLGIDPLHALQDNDAYHFFRRVGGLIISGPTSTNVNDLYLLVAL